MCAEVTEVRRMAQVSRSERGKLYSGPIIDCDVHHNWPSQDVLLPYLSDGWREYVLGPGREGHVPMNSNTGFYNPHGFFREDTYPDSGGKPGTDYETLKTQLLDAFNIKKAVLTYAGDGLQGVSGLRNPYFAAEVARAANLWTIDNWLARDKRLVSSILIANQLPEVAAEEIRRVGTHPQMVQVIMGGNGLGQALGHPLFHPIYEAAAELGLPIALHIGGSGGMNPPPAAGGSINFYIEYHTQAIQPFMTHLVSILVHGVFEKFPTLKLILIEGGVAWVPGLLWRLDANYKGCRREIPWVKRLPSEYFREHVKLTSQPLELSPKREQMIELLRFIDGEDTVLFATDYPHWDEDDVDYVATRLPKEWLAKIYYENAKAFYGWSDEELLGSGLAPLAVGAGARSNDFTTLGGGSTSRLEEGI